MKGKETEVSRVCPSSSSSSPIRRHCYFSFSLLPPRSIGEHRFGGKTYKPFPLQQPSIVPFWSQRLQQTLTACAAMCRLFLHFRPHCFLLPPTSFLPFLFFLPPLLLALPPPQTFPFFFVIRRPFCGFLAVWGPPFHLASFPHTRSEIR